MNHFLTCLILAFAIIGIQAGPGKKGRLDMASCLTPETIQSIKAETEDCAAQNKITAGGDPKEKMGKEVFQKQIDCLVKKAAKILAGINAASPSDAVSMLAKTNLTADVQENFITATTECVNTKSIKLEDLTKDDSKIEDWKPALECLKTGLMKACKPASGSTDPDLSQSMEDDGN